VTCRITVEVSASGMKLDNIWDFGFGS